MSVLFSKIKVAQLLGHLAAPSWSHVNGPIPHEKTIKQTTETIPTSSKTITAAGMTTNRITSLQEMPPFRSGYQ